MKFKYIILFLISVLLFSCSKDEDTISKPSNNRGSGDNQIIEGKWKFKNYSLINDSGFPVDTVIVNDTLVFNDNDSYYYIKNGDSTEYFYTMYQLYGDKHEFYYMELILPNLGTVKSDNISIYFTDRINEVFNTDNDKSYRLLFVKL